MNREKIKSQADKIIKASDLNFPLNSLPDKIAKAHLKHNGFYSYTDANTNQKILVEA